MNYPTELQTPYIPQTWEGYTKKDLAEKADAAVTHLLETGAPLRMVECLSAMELFCETVKKDARFKAYVLDELAKDKGKHKSKSGTLIEACETAVSYDYSANSEWNALTNDIKRLTDRRKEIEERLKRIEAGKLLVDEETGETLVGAPKSSKTSFKVTLAK